ncbi:MAG: hypothetical protein K8I03_15945 [Ignavibacteria bacterium]|nr:hypothetical protein [Ignavibacteria bacterium]
MKLRSALTIRNKLVNLYLFAFFAGLTFILYYTSLNNFYVLDDFSGLRAASEGSLFVNFHFIPVPLLAYRILYLLFGESPIPVRVLSYLLNALMCVGMFRFSFRFLSIFLKDVTDERKLIISFYASLLFCVHFIHVETIIYYSELHEMFYSLFYLYGLYFYLLFRSGSRSRNLVFVYLFYMFCILSKETAPTFIACIFLSELLLFKSSAKDFMKKYYPLFFITIGFALIRYFFFSSLELLSMPASFISVIQETIKNYIFSFTAFIVSLDFIFIKDIYRSNGSASIATLRDLAQRYPFAIAGITASFIVYVIILRKFSLLKISLVVFSVVVISSFSWLAGYERYLFLPSVGFCLLLSIYLFNNAWLNTFNKMPLFIIIAGIIVYNVYSLKDKESHWITASKISEKTVTRILDLTRELPPRSIVYFKGLPGEYKSAWILRFGISEIPGLFLKRNDMNFYYIYQKPEHNVNEENIYVYDYDMDKIYKE